MPRTGRSISGTSRAMAAATCSSTSIRSGPIRRSISSASTTTCRSPTGATGSSMPTRPRVGPRSTTGPTCRGTSRAAKASTGSMPAPPTAPRRSARRSRDGARRQAVGLPLQGSARLVVEPALRPPGRGGERDADGMGAAVQADLVHRTRLPRHRPRHEPAQRLLRPEVVGELHAAFLAGLAR